MKFLRIFICALLCVIMAVSVCAETCTTYTFDYYDENITVNVESSLDETDCKKIADYVVYGKDDAEINTISFCWLFGHDLSTSSVIVIRHKVSPTSPRCLEEKHRVTTCSKCDYMKDEIASSHYIPCHPGE